MNDLYSLFLDSDDVIYWVVFQESDLNSTATFLRTVRTGDIYEFLQWNRCILNRMIFLVNRTEDGITFRDDHFDYYLKFNDEVLGIYPYPTE